MSDEIRETVFIGIGAMLLASVLLFMTLGLQLRKDFAQTRNNQLVSELKAQEYREFNKYNGLEHAEVGFCSSDVTGWEVVAAIRNYINSTEIEIYVDRDKEDNELVVQSYLVRQNPEVYSLMALKSRFKVDDRYHPMLIYDGYDPKEVNNPQINTGNSKVTGIKFIKVDTEPET